MNPQPHPLDALERALDDERRALIGHDVEALMASTQAKLVALRQVEGWPLDPQASERVQALSALNQANGALLARRRREVNWSLRHLGRQDSNTVYDATGLSGAKPTARSLGVG